MHITICGVPIYYEQQGLMGPNILLLHGWQCSTALWKPVAAYLARSARVTALDFPGHGQSSRPPQPWDAGDFANMTAAFIEALNLAPCDIIGHSHGGRVALRLALDRPDLIHRLVITGGAGLRGKPTAKQQSRQKTFRLLRSACDKLDGLKILGNLPEKGREALRRKYGSPDYNALDAEMRKTFVKLVQTDLAQDLPRIKASTLLIWGDRDTETPLWMGQQMERDIPDAGLVVLEGGTHFAYLEQADRFCRIVEQFLMPSPPPEKPPNHA